MHGSTAANSDKRLTIGLITSQVHTRVFEDQWHGVFKAAEEMDVNLVIYPGSALDSPYGFEKQGNLLYETALQPAFFDGIVIWSGALDWFISEDELVNFSQRFSGLPLVSMETPLPGVPTIGIGNYQGMWDLVQHLLVVHGYRRVAFVKGPEGHGGVRQRYQAYCDCLETYNIAFDPDLIVRGDFSNTSGKTAVSILLDERQVDFDVIVSANDKMAVGALIELQERGIVVPFDKAVVGFDDDQVMSPPLTTTSPPFFEMGYIALETCVSLVKGHDVPDFIEMPAELIIRRSCGCLPQELEETWLFESPLLDSPSSIRECIITAVVEAVPNAPPFALLDTLAKAFEHSIAEEDGGAFLSKFDEILMLDVTNGNDLKRWHEVISVFRKASRGQWDTAEQARLAEDLYHQARLLVIDTQQWSFEYQVVEAEQSANSLREIGDLLITSFGLEDLKNLIAEMFPKVGVCQCAVALYKQGEPPVPKRSELLVIYDEYGRCDSIPSNIWEFPKSMLPLTFINQEARQTFIIAPLYFREENLGVVVLGIESKDGMVYETLRMQVSSALKQVRMVEDIKNAQDRLELGVAQRTSELVQEVFKHKQTAQALQKSEATTRALLEAIPDAIFLLDEQARFLNFMPSEGMKTAVSMNDYLGLTLADVFPPDLAENFAYAIPEAIHKESILLQEYPVKIGHEIRYYEARLLSIGEGNVLGIIRDITERKTSETEREQLITELEVKNAELERFTYTVSHDLKSPLVTIRGFVGFLETDIAEQNWENVPSDLNYIKQAAEKMQTLLQDLLDLSRLGRVVNPTESVPFIDIVHEASLNLAFQYEEQAIKLIVPMHMPSVSVDRLRMQEVMQNLLENAAKFMGDQIEPVVEIGSSQNDDEYLFFVKDNGMGLDSKYHEKAFDLFERIHPEVEGTGVGLALVKRIIELHNGRIWVESPGRGFGSTFFFTLPLSESFNHE